MSELPTGSACYMLTGRGSLMPGIVRGDDGRGLVAVEAPQGKIYTTAPVNVFDVPTGRVMLMHKRAEQMAAQGYLIKVRLNGDFRMFHPKKHGINGGYILRRCGDHLTCDCPSYPDGQNCKHQMAVCSLLLKRAERLREAGKVRVATRYVNLAGVIHSAAA